jgi:NADH-quinone oxidoreductase subunit C
MIDHETLLARLQAAFGDAVTSAPAMRSGESVFHVASNRIADVALWLRDDEELAFAFLENLCGVDYLGRTPRFEVVYHLLSMTHRQRICLKVGVPDTNLHLPTLTGVWQTANYQEREAYDMFGFIFDGHPNLERILMPDDWNGHPQRKDVPLGYEEVAFSINDEQIYARKPFAQE